MIKVSQLKKAFKKRIVFEDLNIHFLYKVNLIVGPNGIGKSTLLKILGGIALLDTFDLIYLKKVYLF